MNNHRWERSSKMLAITLVSLARLSRMMLIMNPVSPHPLLTSGLNFCLSWKNKRRKECNASSQEEIQKRELRWRIRFEKYTSDSSHWEKDWELRSETIRCDKLYPTFMETRILLFSISVISTGFWANKYFFEKHHFFYFSYKDPKLVIQGWNPLYTS